MVLDVQTKREGDVVDLTGDVEKVLHSSELNEGLACVFAPHSTAAVFTIESEPGVQQDVRDALQRLLPKGIEYEHHKRWGDGNGHAHVRAAFLGPSLTVPFIDGALDLGTWQQIVLMELDNRGRSRKVVVQLIGSSSEADKK
jgi:secondary thiamine-phosphate synthase enzyme